MAILALLYLIEITGLIDLYIPLSKGRDVYTLFVATWGGLGFTAIILYEGLMGR